MVQTTGTDSLKQNQFDKVAFKLGSTEDSIVAKAGGGQATARLLTCEFNRIITVASAADSVKLPVSVPGLDVMIINDGANSMQVFGSGTDTIDAVATATGVPLAAASRANFMCVTAGKWQSASGAKSA